MRRTAHLNLIVLLSVRTELVTTLKRKATEILSQLENEKAPILITQYGRPAAYLVDVETYDELQRRLAVLQGIARGERAIEDGRTLSQAEAKKRMARWLK
jgi:prevent-host-death family protein